MVVKRVTLHSIGFDADRPLNRYLHPSTYISALKNYQPSQNSRKLLPENSFHALRSGSRRRRRMLFRSLIREFMRS